MSMEQVLQPLIACVGTPVGGNPTQFVMTRIAREAELDWRFFTSQVPLESFETAFRGIQALGMAGAAILPPFQGVVQAYLDRLSPGAKALGVVHVAKWDSSQWVGEETLSPAVLRALTHRFSESVSGAGLEQDESFAPQSIAVLGSERFAAALQVALAEFPGDYSVFLVSDTTPHTPEGNPNPSSSMVSGSVTPSKVAQPRVATQSEFFDEASPSNRILNVEGSRSISSTEGVAQGGDSFSGDLVPEISKHGASNSSGSPVRSEVASGADRTEVATVPQLRLDDLSLTERPVRALIIEQVDAMMDRSAAARHRLFKDAIWAAHPVAVLIPPALGWVEASKGRSQCIDELKQQGLEWIDEIEVLTHQSAINFEFWTGYEPELDSIRESLEEYLQW
jgi:Shikimate dehydrogenase substrate binding domain